MHGQHAGYGGSSTGDAAFASFVTGQNTFNLSGGASTVLSTRFNGSLYGGGGVCNVP